MINVVSDRLLIIEEVLPKCLINLEMIVKIMNWINLIWLLNSRTVTIGEADLDRLQFRMGSPSCVSTAVGQLAAKAALGGLDGCDLGE